MTLTFVQVTTGANAWINYTYLSSFDKIGPRSFEVLKFRLWPPVTLTFAQVTPSGAVLGSTYIHLSSFVKIGSRAKEILKFNVWPQWPWPLPECPLGSNTGVSLHPPIKFRQDQTKGQGDIEIRPLTPVTLTFAQVPPWGQYWCQPTSPYQVSSRSDQGPGRYWNSTFDPSDLDLCPSAPSGAILGPTYTHLPSFVKIGQRVWEME